MVKFVDVRGKVWTVYRNRWGHYFAKHEFAEKFTRCKVSSIAKVWGHSTKLVCESLKRQML